MHQEKIQGRAKVKIRRKMWSRQFDHQVLWLEEFAYKNIPIVVNQD
jgi:hypothetical protein